MGASSTKARLSAGHREALSAYSDADVAAMQAQFTDAVGKGHTCAETIDALLAALHAQGAGVRLRRGLWHAVTQTAAAAAAERADAPRKAAPAGCSVEDVVLLKFRLERGGREARAEAARLLLVPAASPHEVAETVFEAFALRGGAPPPPGLPAREHIAAAAAALAEHVASPAAFSTALRAWPGLPGLLAGLTAAFPSSRSACVNAGKGKGGHGAAPPLLPRVFGVPPDKRAADAVLLPAHTRTLLASLLPDAQRREWRLLFNSDMHGKSYASFAAAAMDAGPTLLVVRDAGGALFGGYAADPWRQSGTFFGSAACFLFRLLPSFEVCFASGANDNYQWCGYRFKELPDGFGFGGTQAGLKVTYLSLYLDSTLDSGSSRPTATFAAPCLASAEKFAIDCVECWRVEPPDEGDDAVVGGGGGVAMDNFKEDAFLLEMHGRRLHSAGERAAGPE